MTEEICRFGLVVTGKGEEMFLPRLFRVLMGRAYCAFTVIRRVGQRDPVTAPTRLIRMVRTGQRLPTKDEEDIGLPVLAFLRKYPGSFAILVDDLEGDRRDIADRVFSRYRTALDEVLTPAGLQERAAVHFTANMLEAYYFADAGAVNKVAGIQVLADDYPNDVEQIRHPKGEIKRLWPEFDEIKHGRLILSALDVEHVLSRPSECCWLRTMFVWCVAKLSAANAIHDETLQSAFHVGDGCNVAITAAQ